MNIQENPPFADHAAPTVSEDFHFEYNGSHPVNPGLLLKLDTTADMYCTGAFDPSTYITGEWNGPTTPPACS